MKYLFEIQHSGSTSSLGEVELSQPLKSGEVIVICPREKPKEMLSFEVLEIAEVISDNPPVAVIKQIDCPENKLKRVFLD
ncbi:hypothetical protein ACFL54_01295 [Planctomycetota bacterium]